MKLKEKLETLSEIAKKLEDPEIELEEAMQLYSEGVKLADECRKQLTEANQKIVELSVKDENHE